MVCVADAPGACDVEMAIISSSWLITGAIQPADTKTPLNNERWADQITASIALRSRIRHPTNPTARFAMFEREIARLPQVWNRHGGC